MRVMCRSLATLNGEEHSRLVTQLLMDDQVYLCVADSLLKRCYGDEAENLKKRASGANSPALYLPR